MNKNLIDFINENEYLLLDGGIGTLLHENGYDYSTSMEKFILNHKDLYISILKDYEKSGSNIIYTPTFLGNNNYISNYGINTEEEKKMTKEIIKIIRNNFHGFIFGCIGSLDPKTEYSDEQLNEIYKDQIETFIKSKVDAVIIETQTNLKVAKFLVEKTYEHFPCFVTFALKENNQTFDNLDIVECYRTLESHISGFGINCSSFDSVLFGLKKLKQISKVPLISKPSMGIPGVNTLKTPDEFASFSISALESGAKLIGGCCGTSPKFIEAAKQKINEYYKK